MPIVPLHHVCRQLPYVVECKTVDTAAILSIGQMSALELPQLALQSTEVIAVSICLL